MKKIVSMIMVVILLASFSGIAGASEVDDLRKELQELRADYESRIQKLETQIDTMNKSQEESVARIEKKIGEKIGLEYVGRYVGPFKKGGLLIRNPSGFGNVSVGGYADIDFENFENTNSTFDQHRWVINIGAELEERLRFYSEYEIEHGGPNAQNTGQGEAKVEQAWIDYLINTPINFRAGALLVPFGRYNLYHDSDLQELTERPIVARDIIPTTWTESGAGLYGEFNPIIGNYEDLQVGYEAYVINGLDNGFSDTGMGGARGSISSDNNHSKALVGRLVLSPKLGHEIGLSGYMGRYNTAGDSIRGGAIDWLSTWGALDIVGEYAYFDVDEPIDSDVANYFKGYRIEADYHFWPEFLNNTFLGKGFDEPALTLVGRYGSGKIDDDSDAGTGDNEENRFTLGLNYRPVPSWVFKTEYQWNSTKNENLERGDNNGFMTSIAMGF